MNAQIEMKWGQLRLKTLALSPSQVLGGGIRASLDGKSIAATSATEDGRFMVTFPNDVVLKAGQKLLVEHGVPAST
jgi:hypothetical protein